MIIFTLEDYQIHLFKPFGTNTYYCPASSLNSLYQVTFLFTSSTSMSNLRLTPALILLNAATARSALLCNSEDLSRSCLTVSLVTAVPFMVFSSRGVTSSKRCAMAAGAIWERRKSIMWEMTLISSESSESPGTRRSRNSCKLSFAKHVSS